MLWVGKQGVWSWPPASIAGLGCGLSPFGPQFPDLYNGANNNPPCRAVGRVRVSTVLGARGDSVKVVVTVTVPQLGLCLNSSLSPQQLWDLGSGSSPG